MSSNSNNTETSKCCEKVKLAVFCINLIGSSVSLLFLIFCIIKMIKKKNITTLTTIILLIFFAEVVQCVPKFIQLLKIVLEDQKIKTIICQIQIVLSIYADFCSLVCTFLLSLKCYDVLLYKNKYFLNNKRTKIKLIIFTVLGSLSAGVIFLIVDLRISQKDDSYESRDRCTYRCWLGHITSQICYGFYWILLIGNIVLFVKTRKFLNLKERELYEENEQMLPYDKNVGNEDNIKGKNKEIENEDDGKDDNKKLSPQKIKKFNKNDARINGLLLIKKKCTAYPLINIIFWGFLATYRIIDDTTKDNSSFDNQIFFRVVIQTFLIMHSFFSSTRGFFFGISFIALEEKMFGNFFRKCFGIKSEIYTKLEDSNRDNEYNEEENNEEEEYKDGEDNYENDGVLWRISENNENIMKTNTNELKIIEN